MSVREIKQKLLAVESQDDLREINAFVVERMRSLARRKAMTFQVGQMVYWEGKNGRQEGRISKVMQKNLVVDTAGNGRWKVNAGMVKAV